MIGFPSAFFFGASCKVGCWAVWAGGPVLQTGRYGRRAVTAGSPVPQAARYGRQASEAGGLPVELAGGPVRQKHTACTCTGDIYIFYTISQFVYES